MTYKVCYWDADTQSQQERDCTPEEIAEIEQRIIDAAKPVIPTPDQIKAQIAALDLRRIRPLAEGDIAYLGNLTEQIRVLRAQL